MLAERFEVVSTLAHGGMADVVEARDVPFGGRRVAVKLLREGFVDDPEVVLRFEREARIASTLKSRHVVEILDCGVMDGGRPFIVTELLTGQSLASELAGRGALPVEEAALYVAQACHAMIEAHDAGIVHRDLKPSNLFLSQEGARRMVKVLDFGIARMAPEHGDDPLTHTKSMFGTPLYMSPESFRSAKKSDARSDVWSLGVIFYECLTGTVPFHAETGLGVGLAASREPHVAPTQRRADLPHSTDVVIARALKKNPRERYQSVRELMAALEVYLPRGRNETMELRRVGASDEIEDDQSTQRGLPQFVAPARAPLLSDPDTSDAPTKIGHLDAHEAPTRIGQLDADDMPTRIARSQPPPLPPSQPSPRPGSASGSDAFEPVPLTLVVPPAEDDSVPGTLVMTAGRPAPASRSTQPLLGDDPTVETSSSRRADSLEFDLEKQAAEAAKALPSTEPDEPMTDVKRPPLSSLPSPFDGLPREEIVRPVTRVLSPLPPPPGRRKLPFVVGFVSAAIVLVALAWVVARFFPRAPQVPPVDPAAAQATADAVAPEVPGAETSPSAATPAEPLAVAHSDQTQSEPEAIKSAAPSTSAIVKVTDPASVGPGPKPRAAPKKGNAAPPLNTYDPSDI